MDYKRFDEGGQAFLRTVCGAERVTAREAKTCLAESLAPEIRVLMSGIRRTFDSKNILNPGKVV